MAGKAYPDKPFFRVDWTAMSENGGDAITAGYKALNMGDLTLISHLIPGTLRGYALVAASRARSER